MLCTASHKLVHFRLDSKITDFGFQLLLDDFQVYLRHEIIVKMTNSTYMIK